MNTATREFTSEESENVHMLIVTSMYDHDELLNELREIEIALQDVAERKRACEKRMRVLRSQYKRVAKRAATLAMRIK